MCMYDIDILLIHIINNMRIKTISILALLLTAVSAHGLPSKNLTSSGLGMRIISRSLRVVLSTPLTVLGKEVKLTFMMIGLVMTMCG